jgi:hypothetical protein
MIDDYKKRIAELEDKVRHLEDMRCVEASNIINLAKDLGIHIPFHAITIDGVFQQFRTGLFDLLQREGKRTYELTAKINEIRSALMQLHVNSNPYGIGPQHYGRNPPQPQYKDPTNRDDSFIWNSITNKVGFTAPTLPIVQLAKSIEESRKVDEKAVEISNCPVCGKFMTHGHECNVYFEGLRKP